MVSHWDDLPWERREHGDRRFERQSLSRARGSAGATLSRYRIAAGDRSDGLTHTGRLVLAERVGARDERLLVVVGVLTVQRRERVPVGTVQASGRASVRHRRADPTQENEKRARTGSPDGLSRP